MRLHQEALGERGERAAAVREDPVDVAELRRVVPVNIRLAMERVVSVPNSTSRSCDAAHQLTQQLAVVGCV